MTYYENLHVIRENKGYTHRHIFEILETTQPYYFDY